MYQVYWVGGSMLKKSEKRRQRFTIRRLSVGVCSLLIGALIVGSAPTGVMNNLIPEISHMFKASADDVNLNQVSWESSYTTATYGSTHIGTDFKKAADIKEVESDRSGYKKFIATFNSGEVSGGYTSDPYFNIIMTGDLEMDLDNGVIITAYDGKSGDELGSKKNY